MTSPGNEQLVRRFVKAIETGDIPTLTDLLDERATWTLHGTLPVAGHYEGRDAILNDFLSQGLGLYAPGSLKIELTNIISTGNTVAIEWHATGHSASGNNYDNDYAFFFRIDNNKILAIREYCDTLHVRDALYA